MERARGRSGVRSRGGWETTSPSGLGLSNDPGDRARVTFGSVRLQAAGRLSVDAQFGSARPARRKGVIPCVRASCVCVSAHDPRVPETSLPAENPFTLDLPRGDST